MSDMLLSLFLRFPGCRKAYEEVVKAGYLKEKVCEDGTDETGGAKRWCVSTVIRAWDDALGAKRAKVMGGDNGTGPRADKFELDTST